jgi:para-aminobenzoate synthetase component 1
LSDPLTRSAETTLVDWANAGTGWTCWPYLARFERTSLPADWSALLKGRYAVLLESGRTGSFTIAIPQSEEVRVYESTGRSRSYHAGGAYEVGVETPLDFLNHYSRTVRAPKFSGWPSFQGGWAMLLAYELAGLYEPVKFPEGTPVAPLAVFFKAKEVYIFDHQTQALTVVVLCETSQPDAAIWRQAQTRAEVLAQAWSESLESLAPALPVRTNPAVPLALSLPEAPFVQAVDRCQTYIAAGDTYQVNLSTRFEVPEVDVSQAYGWLRVHNPSPYMGLLRYPGGSLVCGSPELLVQVEDGKVFSRPIAGTRPRGADEKADLAWAQELAGDTKERAEHLMLVDLLRNDIGRVAQPGTVSVPEFMTVERYSHVMHLVSQVEGKIATTTTAAEVVRALFPGGTITGAPKVRTMQIIAELEPIPRGFYTGSMGWLAANGSLALNIIIRSLWVTEGRTLIQAGAGIVADSVPLREFKESCRKAQAPLMAAIPVAQKSC